MVNIKISYTQFLNEAARNAPGVYITQAKSLAHLNQFPHLGEALDYIDPTGQDSKAMHNLTQKVIDHLNPDSQHDWSFDSKEHPLYDPNKRKAYDLAYKNAASTTTAITRGAIPQLGALRLAVHGLATPEIMIAAQNHYLNNQNDFKPSKGTGILKNPEYSPSAIDNHFSRIRKSLANDSTINFGEVNITGKRHYAVGGASS